MTEVIFFVVFIIANANQENKIERSKKNLNNNLLNTSGLKNRLFEMAASGATKICYISVL